MDIVETGIHGGAVHVDDLLALLGIGLHDGLLHILHGLVDGHDAGELEESRLQHGVRAVAKADSRGDVGGVDGIELQTALGDDALGPVGQMLFKARHIPVGVQQEGAAFLDLAHDVKALHVALLVTCHEVRHRDVVGGADGLMAEAQVALGHAAGLLRVILKVGLGVLVGVVADDLDGVLVGADGSVRAEAPELAGDDALAGGDDVLAHRERGEGDVVVDADGEVVLLLAAHVVVHGLDMRGNGILGGEAVAPA